MMRLSVLAAVMLCCGVAVAAEEKPPAITAPQIPDRTFDITKYGAVADGKTLNTKALADAIAAATQAGGGRVVVPAGTFLIGRTKLASNLDLHLDAGARLLLSDAADAYRSERGRGDDCITADKCHDVAVTGPGTIDGQGERWWDAFRKIKGTPAANDPVNHRPHLLAFNSCQRVRVADVTLTNSPMFHLVPRSCTDVTISGVTIKAPANAPNTDAIDPSGWHYAITNCTLDVGDDNIAIKATGPSTPDKLSCEDFYVADCTMRHGHGLSVGGQTPGGLRRLTVRHCTFEDTDAGIRLKAGRGSGGLVEDLSYSDLTMTRVKVPLYITSYYPKDPSDPAADAAQPVTAHTPIWRDIHITNVTATDCPEAGRILGLPEMPVGSILLTNVHITAKKGLVVSHADDVHFENSTVTVTTGADVTAYQAKVTGLPQQ